MPLYACLFVCLFVCSVFVLSLEIVTLTKYIWHLHPDSFATKVTRFYQPAFNVQDDSDSDSETGASPKTASEDIVIEEKKRLNTVRKSY